MEILIDKAKADELLAAIVAEHGDFVYKNTFGFCNYVVDELDVRGGVDPDTVPVWGCIVGQVLEHAGMDHKELQGVAGALSEVRDDLASCGVSMTNPAYKLLSLAQGWQDGSEFTWAECVALAKAGLRYTSYGHRYDEDVAKVVGVERAREMGYAA
jgi:hypothetical protein